MDVAAVDSKVRQVVSGIRNLPTPPIVFQQIQKVMNDPDVSPAQVAKILAEDPAMSVKVLKLTNSAFYGLTREVDSVNQAVIIVGLEAVKNLVLSASVLEMFKSDHLDKEYHEHHWRHSLSTGFCCRILASRIRSRGFVNPDSAFSGGLLHDIGKMVIACYLPEEFSKVLELRAQHPDLSDFELENKVLAFNHAQVGGVLAEVWKLPERLVESIVYHHEPQSCSDEDAIVYLIHLADYLTRKTFQDSESGSPPPVLQPGVLEFLEVTEENLDAYTEELREEYLKAETFMQMAGLAG